MASCTGWPQLADAGCSVRGGSRDASAWSSSNGVSRGSGAEQLGERMRREQRLRHRKDFAAAYRQGRTQGNQLLVVRVRPNGTGVTRFGFVAGKIVGDAA